VDLSKKAMISGNYKVSKKRDNPGRRGVLVAIE
jgi:hypothetical protein